MDAFSKMLGWLVAILTIVIAPIMILSIQTNSTVETHIKNKTTTFVDECRATGYISPENYLEFSSSIMRAGGYSIDIEYKKKVTYPVEERNAEGSYSFTGETRTLYSGWYTDDILSYMFPEDQPDNRDFLMNQGDMLYITVRKTTGNTGSRLLQSFSNVDTAVLISRYGGLVGNNKKE